MKSDWETVKLGDIADITKLAGYEFTKHIKYDDSGEIIALRSLNVVDGQLDLSNVQKISKAISNNLPRSKLYINDILLTYTGSKLGDTALIDADEKYHLAPNVCRLRAKKNQDSYYIYLYLRSKEFAKILDNFKVGSGQPTVPMKNIRVIPIPFPHESVRINIGKIYASFNNKIELNRKMNQTLEAMASAIFESWFVDFDPVHAKAKCTNESDLETAAKELGISKEILDLFPSEFEESELGMIPKGWKNDYLDNFVEILDSKRVPLASNEREKIKGDIPYYGATSIMGYVNDYIFDETLLLMGEDGSVVRDNGTPFLQYIWGKSWVNNHAHVMKSKSSLSIEALYIALLDKNVTMFVTGAVQPKINQGNLKQVQILNAGEIINKIFSKLIEPIFAKIRLISEENITLQKTRDTLLPKLLNGEIDVSEVEG